MHVKNPDARILGYQLEFDGLQISQTESLLDSSYAYTGSPSHAPGGDQVMTVAYDGMSVAKNLEYVPLFARPLDWKCQWHGMPVRLHRGDQ